MNPTDSGRPTSTPSTDEVMVRSVTVIAAVVVALTFIFGFGNVLNLALRLGVPVWVAPLVAPAVDLSILGLLLGTRHLAPGTWRSRVRRRRSCSQRADC